MWARESGVLDATIVDTIVAKCRADRPEFRALLLIAHRAMAAALDEARDAPELEMQLGDAFLGATGCPIDTSRASLFTRLAQLRGAARSRRP